MPGNKFILRTYITAHKRFFFSIFFRSFFFFFFLNFSYLYIITILDYAFSLPPPPVLFYTQRIIVNRVPVSVCDYNRD